MKKLIRRFPIIVVCAVSVLFMALFAACSGVAVPTTNSPATVTGTIKSVNTSNGSVTLTVNGQDVWHGALTPGVSFNKGQRFELPLDKLKAQLAGTK